MAPLLRVVVGTLGALLVVLALAGCAAKADSQGAFAKAAGRIQVGLDATVVVPACSVTPQAGGLVLTCTFTDATTPGTRTSSVLLAGLSAADIVQTRPVVIIEVPSDANAFFGSYDNQRGMYSRTSGQLSFAQGYTSLPVDGASSLVAEDGMQLVVLTLPAYVSDDNYFMFVSYQASTTQVKGLAAARVLTADGSTYYAPLVPCTSDFGSVPAVPVPNTPIETAIDVRSISSAYVGCSGKTYTYPSSTTPPPPQTGTVVTIVEFYNRQLDHYFITWISQEISALDRGVIGGGQRTGRFFKVWRTPEAGTSPVCRFYIPPEFGNSHFFGRGTDECTQTGLRNPSFVLEDAAFMYVVLPIDGTCPGGTQPVYRVFSNRPDANHRYMTDPAERDAMVANGWLAEGDGPTLVVMCVPV